MPTAIRWVISGLCAGLLVLPAVASAADGGTSAPLTPAPGTPAPTATAGALTVTPSSVMDNQLAVVSGSVPAADAGQTVWLQVRQGSGAWSTVVSSAAAADGSFAIAWRASRTGQLTLRVVSSELASASSVTATPVVALSVYQQVLASWYGPGFFGNRTACGEKLTKHMVGIADRTLPCGTAVTLTYNGRTLTVPVIDRGPYAKGVTLDLTRAAAQELGVTETVSVAMLRLSGPPLAPTDWFPPSSPATGATGTTGATATTPPAVAGGATAPSGA